MYMDRHNLGIYTKIGFYLYGYSQRFMTSDSFELDKLNSLDPQAISAIHDQYYTDVYRFARFRVSDEATAEDITGEVFIRLLEAVHKGIGPRKNLRGWLLRTTANIVNDYFRKLYNRPVENPAEIHENSMDLYIPQEDPVLILERAEQKQVVQKALEKLTDAQKLVITLRFANKLSLEDTAKLMGKNANTIKALQCRALASLRKNIGSEIE
jgi:RNA polymerase sigma-70 factor, ECF subfamily